MARIIAEAAVRLVVDYKELGKGVRNALRAAVRDAVRDSGIFDPITRDNERASRNVNRTWSRVLGGLRASIGSVLSVAGGVAKVLLIGTAAGAALAGVASLTTGLLALGQAAVAASGAVALLPAVLVALKALTATVKIGLVGMDDAFKALGKDAAEFEEAIKDLAPEAQKFMRTMRQLKPAFDDLRMDVQNRLFLGLSDVLKDLAGKYLPVAERLFVTIAGSINNAARNLGDFLGQAETVGQVTNVVDNIRLAFNNLVPAVVPFTQAMLTIVDVGSTFLPRLSASLTDAAERFSDFIDRAAGTGQLEAFIQRAIDTITQLGRILANVFATVGNVMDASAASGMGLLDNLERITRAARDFSGSFAGQAMISGFFAELKRVIDAVWPSVRTLVQVFVRDFVPILADIASTVGPVLRPLFEAFGRLLQALRPLLQALADAFATVLAAMEPVFDALAEALEGAMPALQPVIQDIAEAFVSLIESMIPLIPVFFDLLEAILPILPPFIQMVADLMPSFIDLINAAMPLIQALANAFVVTIPVITDIAAVILNVLIPAFRFIIDILAGVINAVVTFGQGFWSVVSSVFTTVSNLIRTVWTGISTFFSQILPTILGKIRDWITNVLRGIGQWGIDLFNKGKDAMRRFASAIGDGIGNVVKWFKDLPGKVFSAIGDFVGKLVQLGKDLISGLIDGIKSMVQRVIDSVTGLVTDALDAAKALLGIKSPSKVFRELGINVGQGLILGLNKITPQVADAAAEMVSFATDALATPVNANLGFGAASGGTAGGAVPLGGTVINQTNVMRPGTDVKQFSDLVLGRSVGDYLSGASTLSVARNGVQAGVNDQWVG